jgi:general secretion pathway protein A
MASTPTVPKAQQHRLRTHFGMSALPFRKNVGARQMFDSSSQRELRHALPMWLDLKGLALVTGPSGVGKSITVRRFVAELPDNRFAVHLFGQIPTTPTGFLRALCRRLGLPMRRYAGDMFDDVTALLKRWCGDQAAHPVLIMDDAEGMRPATLDLVRRLTASDLDADEHISILLVGTEALLTTLREPMLEPLRTRLAYVHALQGFGLDDTRNYVHFHLEHAGVFTDVLTTGAVRHLFQASGGVPRLVNQLALQAMIQAVVKGLDEVDEALMKRVLLAHPLYGKVG